MVSTKPFPTKAPGADRPAGSVRRRSTFFALAFGAALVHAPAAQVPPSDGPLVAEPLAFGIDPATALGAVGIREAQIFHKPEGFRAVPPAPLATPLVDFAVANMFGAFMAPPYPDVDAISLGTDIIPANCAGVITVPPGHWNFTVFSVRNGTVGVADGAINREVGTPGGNAADFFDYVFRPSFCLPPEFVARTFKLADSVDYGMPVLSEVDAVDLAMPLYALEAALVPTLGMPTCPRCPTVYFSVEGSVANLGRVPPGWWGANAASGAIVFASTWNGAAWSVPAVAYTPLDLGLLATDDLDALAVDAFDPGGVQLVYSTLGGEALARSQILFWQPGCAGAPSVPALPLRYAEGTRVSTDIGLVLGDDVDAICFGDPVCQGSHSIHEVQLERTLAQPWLASQTFGYSRQLAVQALRDRTPPANGFGYTLVCVKGHPGGLGAFLVTVPSLYPFSFPAQIPFAVPLTSPFPGAPVTLRLTLPPSAQGGELILQAATVPRVPPFDVRISHALRLVAH